MRFSSLHGRRAKFKSGGGPADTVLHWDQKCSRVLNCGTPDTLVDLVGIAHLEGRVR
jgi:hypothetical protein